MALLLEPVRWTQVSAPVEAAKRVPRRRITRCLSWENVVEVQVDLGGGYSPKLLPGRALQIAVDLPVYDGQV